ncbi:hypothetical protein pipiens_011778 [Culex pipiens pipiens]|uniref:Uncharacterized protein n=1 Tax=Culex pipiens pipiens TaxID=38569 RepID=A0ABD1D4Y3_CULPP
MNEHFPPSPETTSGGAAAAAAVNEVASTGHLDSFRPADRYTCHRVNEAHRDGDDLSAEVVVATARTAGRHPVYSIFNATRFPF